MIEPVKKGGPFHVHEAVLVLERVDRIHPGKEVDRVVDLHYEGTYLSTWSWNFVDSQISGLGRKSVMGRVFLQPSAMSFKFIRHVTYSFQSLIDMVPFMQYMQERWK